ncbi:MAG: PAS domain S-box protein, partial [Chloroflexi bacterium]|nr:PAS domain S-box protein [Chloroflexota bacterium]
VDKALTYTASISKLTPVVFAGRRWTLRFFQPGGLASTTDYSNVWLVFVGGTSISLLLFGLTVSLLRTRVNARRMAEELTTELRASEEKYRVVFNNEIYAICIFDLETLKLLEVNEAYERLYCYSREELISGMTIHDITAEHQGSDAATTQATREGTIFIPLRYHRKKDGTVFPVEIVGGPYEWQGRKVMFALAHDISERKQAEDALLVSESKSREMIANISDVIGIIGLDGIMRYKSPNIERWFGWQPEDLVGTDGWDTVHPDDLERIQREFSMLLEKDNSVKTVEYRYKCKDGSYKLIELTAVNLTNTPMIDGVLMNYHDITERKQAELALQNAYWAYWRMESILEGTQAGTWEWNVQTGETVFNQTWAQIIGYTLDELAPISIKTWERFAHPDDLKQSDELLEKHFTGELPNYEYESRIKHKDGYWVWVLDRGRVINRTSDGKPLMMFGTHQDITLRKQAENELLSSEQRYRDMFEKNSAVKILIDPASGAVIQANQAASRFYGWSTTLLQAMNINQINTLSNEEIIIEMERAAKESRSYFIFRHRLASGDIRDVEVHSSPIDISGRRLLFSIIHDITERKQAEQALRETHDLLEVRVKERTAELITANLKLEKAARM